MAEKKECSEKSFFYMLKCKVREEIEYSKREVLRLQKQQEQQKNKEAINTLRLQIDRLKLQIAKAKMIQEHIKEAERKGYTVIEADHAIYNTLNNCLVIGEYNKIENATNCIFIGESNYIEYATNCETIGEHNYIGNATNCKITGNSNSAFYTTNCKITGDNNDISFLEDNSIISGKHNSVSYCKNSEIKGIVYGVLEYIDCKHELRVKIK